MGNNKKHNIIAYSLIFIVIVIQCIIFYFIFQYKEDTINKLESAYQDLVDIHNDNIQTYIDNVNEQFKDIRVELDTIHNSNTDLLNEYKENFKSLKTTLDKLINKNKEFKDMLEIIGNILGIDIMRELNSRASTKD